MFIGLHRYRIWGVSLAELIVLLSMYVFSALFYYYAVFVSANGEGEPYERFIFEQIIRLLFSIPIWWLMIRKLKEWPIWIKIMLHCVLLPIYVKGWQQTYYWVADYFGLGHLWGNGEIWDIYITTLLYIIQFGVMHGYSYHLQVKEQQAREAALKQLALQSELTALKAQLNPHFLYNVFNTISASVPRELEHTREMIASLADLFRYQLRATQEDLVPVEDEIAFVKKYLELEKARYGTRLQLQLDIANDVLDKKIPPMILQPLVENAIRHGISPKIDGGQVSIQIHRFGEKLQIQIADTGVGVVDKKAIWSKGIGLKNTAQRLEKMYGTVLRLEDNLPSGLKISFEL
ncbi:sensor histidine kinase [Haliscomenobacter sp.]|uniref:sensor histidine kinase n=1 Tax=Haliscomenobacter sp. TaxID=2717303 RepID=UPI003593EEF2